MNKFTKISATALFALFLTACDKPADKPAQQNLKPLSLPEAKQAAQPAEAANQISKLHRKNKLTTTNYLNGTQANSSSNGCPAKLQSDLTAAVQAKDDKKIEEAIKTFNKTVEDTIASLDKLDITAPSVKSIKDQNKEVLSLSSELLVDQLNLCN